MGQNIRHVYNPSPASSQNKYRVSSKREAYRTDPTIIDAARERRIGEHPIQHTAQVHGPLPSQRKALNGVRFEGIVPGMIHRNGNISVRREFGAHPRHHRPRSAGPMRD